MPAMARDGGLRRVETGRYVAREDETMGTNAELYEQDFFAWTQTTAALIRAGKWHEVDPASVAEE